MTAWAAEAEVAAKAATAKAKSDFFIVNKSQYLKIERQLAYTILS